MEIILIKDHEDLGRKGDELKVKDGFARNYLIPEGYAVKATEGALKQLEKVRKARERQREEEIKCAKEKAEKLQTVSCTVEMETGEEDKLFGSVTVSTIVERLREEDIELEKKQIVLESPLNALGTYTVKVKLHPEVKAALKVLIVKKQ